MSDGADTAILVSLITVSVFSLPVAIPIGSVIKAIVIKVKGRRLMFNFWAGLLSSLISALVCGLFSFLITLNSKFSNDVVLVSTVSGFIAGILAYFVIFIALLENYVQPNED